jgi:UDP-glucose 4-epimerase
MRGVDRVFHQAALPSVPRSVEDPAATNRVNVEGTLNVLRAARDAGVHRVVVASSSSVYGDGAGIQREDQPVSPLSPYAVSKLAAEQYCRVFARVYGLPTVALRYFNVFGPRQDPTSEYAAVIARFVRAALSGESLPVHGDGQQSRDFTYVDNVVLANCRAADSERAVGEVFNVAGGQRHSVLDIATELGRLLAPSGIRVGWYHAPPRPGDVRHSLADIEKARRLLGYEVVVGFPEGLRRTLAATRAALVPHA